VKRRIGDGGINPSHDFRPEPQQYGHAGVAEHANVAERNRRLARTNFELLEAAAGADFAFPQIRGVRPPGTAAQARYFAELDLNSRDQGKIVLDRVARNFLVVCASHAAADPDLTIHDALARRGPVRR
jgi:hypothetical protein